MSRTTKKGATSQSIYFEILDSTSSTGGRKTGLAFNTAGLTGYYVRNGAASVAITLATLAAANSAWSSGGFKEVDAANMPGLYRVDVPDAAFATGAESVIITLKGATGMAQVSAEVQLNDNTSADIYARLGAPAGASIAADVAAVKSDTGTILTDVGTGAGAIYTRLGAPSGASLAADLAAVKAVLPAALVSGRIDANIGSVTAGAIAAAAFAANALDAVWSTTVRLLTAGTNIVLAKGTGVTGFNDVTAASIWDIAISGHLTAGSTGAALNAAGSAGDPWTTPLPGAYGAGTAGNIIGVRLDAAITSRLASAGYTAPDNASVTAIKAKTDNLPPAPADETLIIAATDALGASIAAINTALTGAQAEPGQGVPAVNASPLLKLAYLYKFLRNKKTQTATTQSIFADDSTTVDHKMTVSDDGTTMTVGKVASGP